jgi:hypothetical protein
MKLLNLSQFVLKLNTTWRRKSASCFVHFNPPKTPVPAVTEATLSSEPTWTSRRDKTLLPMQRIEPRFLCFHMGSDVNTNMAMSGHRRTEQDTRVQSDWEAANMGRSSPSRLSGLSACNAAHIRAHCGAYTGSLRPIYGLTAAHTRAHCGPYTGTLRIINGLTAAHTRAHCGPYTGSLRPIHGHTAARGSRLNASSKELALAGNKTVTRPPCQSTAFTSVPR